MELDRQVNKSDDKKTEGTQTDRHADRQTNTQKDATPRIWCYPKSTNMFAIQYHEFTPALQGNSIIVKYG